MPRSPIAGRVNRRVIAQLLGFGGEAGVADYVGIGVPGRVISATRNARRSGGIGFERRP
jgi:hypothetical protein